MHIGDKFENIGHDVVIVNRSTVHRAHQHALNLTGKEEVPFIDNITDIIERSNSPAAKTILNMFLEELINPDSAPHTLTNLFDMLRELVPDAQVAEEEFMIIYEALPTVLRIRKELEEKKANTPTPTTARIQLPAEPLPRDIPSVKRVVSSELIERMKRADPEQATRYRQRSGQ